jgi:hypothetical protein
VVNTTKHREMLPVKYGGAYRGTYGSGAEKLREACTGGHRKTF